MSLLSATQGTPERVQALVALLAAHGGALERDAILAWMSPRFARDGGQSGDQKSAVGAVIQCALSLELIAIDGRLHQLASPEASETPFIDDVLDRLCALPAGEPDAVLLQAFAWVVLNSERDGALGWFSDWSGKDLADRIDSDLPPRSDGGTERRFNDTKVPPWRRWLIAAGLMVDLPGAGPYPYVAERLGRELHRGGLPLDTDLPAGQVLEVLARRMPYLDGGVIWRDIAGRMGFTPPDRLSRVLSIALRDLDETGLITLSRVRDTGGAAQLSPDPRHPVQSVTLIRLNSQEVRDAA